jgi:hypothetical protein
MSSRAPHDGAAIASDDDDDDFVAVESFGGYEPARVAYGPAGRKVRRIRVAQSKIVFFVEG